MMPTEPTHVNLSPESPRRAARPGRSKPVPHRIVEAEDLTSHTESRHRPYPEPSARHEVKRKTHKRRSSKTNNATQEAEDGNDEQDGEYELEHPDNVEERQAINEHPTNDLT